MELYRIITTKMARKAIIENKVVVIQAEFVGKVDKVLIIGTGATQKPFRIRSDRPITKARKFLCKKSTFSRRLTG
jgi:hypothetical protein